jgi:hypothetical protein
MTFYPHIQDKFFCRAENWTHIFQKTARTGQEYLTQKSEKSEKPKKTLKMEKKGREPDKNKLKNKNLGSSKNT